MIHSTEASVNRGWSERAQITRIFVLKFDECHQQILLRDLTQSDLNSRKIILAAEWKIKQTQVWPESDNGAVVKM
jgi:hypothetical protein